MQALVSDALLNRLLEIAAVGIVAVDERGRIVIFNQSCEHLFGYTAAEILGRDLAVIMRDDPAETADPTDGGLRWEALLKGEREVTGRCQDGTEFALELSLAETPTPDGRLFIGVLRDLRRRKAADQRLRQLQSDLLRMARVSAVHEMSAALAHELNQPLTAMMLYLHAAVTACERSSVGLPGMALSLIEKANNEAERAASIIQRMRELVEHREPLRRHIEVDVLLRETVALTLSGCALDTQIRCDVESQLPPILVDPVQIQQVVFNLLRNALEAVSQQANRQVRVSARRHSGTIQIAVEDNGTGISPERTAKLFKGFADVDAEMGLSLAISRSIAQNHRGDLSVDPGGDGRGARFTLHLPIPAEDDS